jgi:putative DNA primase/helicase
MRVLKALLGDASVVSPTMSSFGSTFGLEPLIPATLATISDARIGKRTDKSIITERLLSISGEDPLTVARKYLSAWTTTLRTRLMIATNEPPVLTDVSGALPSRFMLLMMTVSFYGRENPHLTEQLKGELPGILNWSIEGYRRLAQRGHFVQPQSSTKMLDEIERLGSPVKAFVWDRCDLGPRLWTSTDVLWSQYQDWFDEQSGTNAAGYSRSSNIGSKNWFIRNLKTAFPALKESRRDGKRKNREYGYEGIGLRVPSRSDGIDELF